MLNQLTSGTDSAFLNSMYAIPLKRFVLLHVINRTSRTLPTALKNSSRSRARIRCDNCIQKIVRESLSSISTSSSERDRENARLAIFGGVRPLRKRAFSGDRERRFLSLLRDLSLKIQTHINISRTNEFLSKSIYFFFSFSWR